MIKEYLKKFKIFVIIYEKLMSINHKLYYKVENNLWRERKLCLGCENPDKIFYVIRRRNAETVGLFSHLSTSMGVIEYAVKMGYIPVVDMQTRANIYLDDSLVGKVNAWEYYFEQPCGYGLKDIEKSKNVIWGDGEKYKDTGYPGGELGHDLIDRDRWKEVANCYIKVKTDLRNETEELYKKWFGNAKVLGCHFRGTDYRELKPSGHPIQPSAEMMIEKVEEIFHKGNYNYIYLATEDEQAYECFKKKFGSLLFASGAKRYSSENLNNEVITVCQSYREQDRYMAGKEYLEDILMLTCCDGLVTGCCGGGYGAILLKSGCYKDEYIFALGTYS